MPSCFQLYRKDSVTKKPSRLTDVDAELCAHFGAPCDPVRWYHGWYDFIGFWLACGKSWDFICEECQAAASDCIEGDSEGIQYYAQMENIASYIEEHYHVNAWHQVGR